MKRLINLSICILCSCAGATNSDQKNTVATTFPNMATITEDSCERWNKPVTAFTVEYPSSYKAEYNQRSNYLDLSKTDSNGIVVQHISLGKNQHIIGKEEIEKWTFLMDSLMHVSPAYNRDTLLYDTYGEQEFYILRGTLNYDFLGQPGFKGNYKMTSFIVPPTGTDRTNGVLWSVMTKDDRENDELRKEGEDVLKTLRFNE